MLDVILPCLDKVRRQGAGYVACCPSHDDKSPSLSLREADDGRILLHCFGGCDVADVLAAIGMTTADLFPPNGSKRRKPLSPGVSRADLEAALQIERGILFILDCDRRVGKTSNDADLEREALALKRIKFMEAAL